VPRVTRITQQKRRANRRNIFLDGKFAFGCSENVVARFRLREGIDLTEQQVAAIELGQVKQECFDSAIKFLQSRLHSTSELRRKLSRKEWGTNVIEATLADLARLGYLDDEKYARTRALSAAQHRHHGPRRAMAELLRAGVKQDVAAKALADVFTDADNTSTARALAMKQAPRLRKLDPMVARRRLAGMLQRRGFDYDTIKPIIDEALGNNSERA